MKVLKSFQHNPLARQCAESVRIKNTDPSKRINNKEEYHQPGDVEVRYKKNVNEKFQKKDPHHDATFHPYATENKKATQQEKPQKKTASVETNIVDFLKEMRRKHTIRVEKEIREEAKDDDDDITSTQSLIEDSRARRELTAQRKTEFECEQCPYKTGSKNIMNRHIKSHQINNCEKESESTSVIIEAKAPSPRKETEDKSNKKVKKAPKESTVKNVKRNLTRKRDLKTI